MEADMRAPSVLLLAAAAQLLAAGAFAHGVVGKRFFPATLTVDDPFVADELSLPTYSYQKLPSSGEEPASSQSSFALDYTKRITPDLGIGLGGSFLQTRPEGSGTMSGWDNFALSLKYQFYQSAEREAIASLGLDWDVGHSGSSRVGAEPFSTVTPALFFGKGFGDLPETAKMLRPLALTGQLGIGIPSRANTGTVSQEGDVTIEQHPNTLVWGFALEYSIPYLQSYVQDMGWREPFSRLIPIVEFSFMTALNRGQSGTTGTINPGLLWAGQKVQLGIEAVIPVNSRSGSRTGVIAQLHFYLDDIFPNSIGKPLFGSSP